VFPDHPAGSKLFDIGQHRARGVLTINRGARNLRALCIMTDPTDTPRASVEMR